MADDGAKLYDEIDFNIPFLQDHDRGTSPDSSISTTPSQLLPQLSFPTLPASGGGSSISPPLVAATPRRNKASSPLNPSAATTVPAPVMSPTTTSSPRNSTHPTRFHRLPSEECRALSFLSTSSPPSAATPDTSLSSRGSMILYRYVNHDTLLPGTDDFLLTPPSSSLSPPHANRFSVYSNSGDSIFSLSADSKYPVAASSAFGSERGLVAYAYDPSLDVEDPAADEEDKMHDPNQPFSQLHRVDKGGALDTVSKRGVFNVATLVVMLLLALCLFVVYPISEYFRDNGKSLLITGNPRINQTGQAIQVVFDPQDTRLIGSFSDYVDRTTPQSAYSFTGTNGLTYDLAFSDEFNVTGSTYKPKENLYWEARNKGLYSSDQVTTSDGQLVIRIDPRTTSTGATQLVGGMLDSKIPFCIGRGFIEVGVHDADGSNKRIFWAGESWLSVNPVDDTYVPSGPSLKWDVSLSLSLGVRVDRNTPIEQIPSSATLNYVRYYERKREPSIPRSACDVERSTRRSVTLDLLNLPL